MIYLSQLLNKTIYYNNKPFGELLDIAIFENRPMPPVSKIMVKRFGKKITLAPQIALEKNKLRLKTQNIPFMPYDESDFYLNEDLLDKQVIDIDGRRVVRVNDVLLENNGELKVVGIDIGFTGILRRLGVNNIFRFKPKTLPWMLIQAFDYKTGAIRIKLTQDRMNTFHPAEIADILEEVGTKERLAIFSALDAKKAAAAIEETDTQTQTSILELLSQNNLKDVVTRMLASKIADVFYKLNPLRIKEILKLLDTEKASKILKLSSFSGDAAGGLMEPSSLQLKAESTVKEALIYIAKQETKNEAIVVTNGNEKVTGIVYLKDLIKLDPLALLKDVLSERKFVFLNADFDHILKLFSQYNLRILPVVDKDKKLLGIITIDTIVGKIEEQKEKNDIL